MSNVHTATSPRELFWELRRQRARALRAIYAMVDPRGWDARRHFANGRLERELTAVGQAPA